MTLISKIEERENDIDIGYCLAVKHIRERFESGQDFKEAVTGMEQVSRKSVHIDQLKNKK